jgi:hypothetical protein
MRLNRRVVETGDITTSACPLLLIISVTTDQCPSLLWLRPVTTDFVKKRNLEHIDLFNTLHNVTINLEQIDIFND